MPTFVNFTSPLIIFALIVSFFPFVSFPNAPLCDPLRSPIIPEAQRNSFLVGRVNKNEPNRGRFTTLEISLGPEPNLVVSNGFPPRWEIPDPREFVKSPEISKGETPNSPLGAPGLCRLRTVFGLLVDSPAGIVAIHRYVQSGLVHRRGVRAVQLAIPPTTVLAFGDLFFIRSNDKNRAAGVKFLVSNTTDAARVIRFIRKLEFRSEPSPRKNTCLVAVSNRLLFHGRLQGHSC